MEIVNGLTIEQWIEKETAPRIAKLWGEGIEFSPALCDEIIGDFEIIVGNGKVLGSDYEYKILKPISS